MKNNFKIVAVLVILIGLAVLLYFFNPFGLGRSKTSKLAEILHYEDIRFAHKELLEFLSDDDPDIRSHAALALGRINNPKTVE